MRRVILALPVIASLLALTHRVDAQRWQVDFAGNTVGYDTASRISSASVAPLVEWNQRMVYATVSGAIAAFEAGQWTSQGHGDVSLLFAPASAMPSLHTELVGSADGSVHSSGYRTVDTRAELRLHEAGRSSGFWVGGTAATGWTSASTGIASAAGPTAGVWGRSGPWNATAVWSPFRFEGAWYQQVEGRVGASVGPMDLTGSVGWRRGPGDSGVASTSWVGGSVALWFTTRAAVVLAAGSYPADLLQALPRGRYLSAGIRLALRRPNVWASPTVSRTVYTEHRGAAELRFDIPGASRVDVAGDWTRWQPVPLTRTPDGRWLLQVNLPSGVYRFNLVVDGLRWIAAEGVGSVDDGFGGKISLFVVP